MTAFTGDIQILLYTEEENFSVCRDVDQTYQELTAAEGIRIVSKPVTQSYGTRYFAVEDPCGNRINLYHSNH